MMGTLIQPLVLAFGAVALGVNFTGLVSGQNTGNSQANMPLECVSCNWFDYGNSSPEVIQALQYFVPVDECSPVDFNQTINNSWYEGLPGSPPKENCQEFCGRAVTLIDLIMFDGTRIPIKWISRQCLDYFYSRSPADTCVLFKDMPVQFQTSVMMDLAVFQRLGFASTDLGQVQFCFCDTNGCNGKYLDENHPFDDIEIESITQTDSSEAGSVFKPSAVIASVIAAVALITKTDM